MPLFTLNTNPNIDTSTSSPSGEYPVGTELIVKCNSESTGYYFDHWHFVGLEGEGVATDIRDYYWYDFEMPNNDVTVEAISTPINYSISYQGIIGTSHPNNPTIYNADTPTFTLINPSKSSYTFSGWTGSNGNVPQTTVTVNTGSTGNKIYYGNWEYSGGGIGGIIINGKSMEKRIVNGREVEKVMCNGSQIWPVSGPTPDTHNYLCFTANTADSVIWLNIPVSSGVTLVPLEISADKINWEVYDGSHIVLHNVGDKVYWRSTAETDTYGFSFPNSWYGDKIYTFGMEGSIAASGDVTYLICKYGVTRFTNILDARNSSTFKNLFRNCTALTSAPELPLLSLNYGCYYNMFEGCTNLTTAPSLPATVLADSCYEYMFSDCTSLVTPPIIAATTLAYSCCYGMFSGCSSLATAPQLQATTLTDFCYRRMFGYCSSLTTAPQLPATTLGDSCYEDMFEGCSSLRTIPQLPATTLTDGCYSGMFYGCTNIKLSEQQVDDYQNAYRIPISGTGTAGSYSTISMFSGTGGTFTGDPTINTTYYTSNTVI